MGKSWEDHRKPWENEGFPSGYVQIAIEHGTFIVNGPIEESIASLPDPHIPPLV